MGTTSGGTYRVPPETQVRRPLETSARSLIGGGRWCRRRRRCRRRCCRCRHVTRLGRRRWSRWRWGRTSRRRLVGLVARLMIGPTISDDQPEDHDNGDDRRHPCPHRPRAAGPLEIETAQRIGAAWIGVARVRHDSPPFLGGPSVWIIKLPTVHNVPAPERRAALPP